MTLVIAHRGASFDAPQNTLEAFELARQQGADWVELDVRLTVDGAVIVHHDAHLTDGRLIRETPTTALPVEVPTLDEALDCCGGMGVNVEMKTGDHEVEHEASQPIVGAVVEVLERRSPGNAILVSSFDVRAIGRFRELLPGVPTGWLTIDLGAPGWAIGVVAGGGHAALNPWDPLVGEELVAETSHAGIEINVWTVDDADRIAELASWGVNGVITNRPTVARAIIDGLRHHDA